jgi:DNA-binding transcriptional ArsR family regulator
MNEDLEPDRCARLLKAMADPDRLRIVQCLRAGPKNVGEIAAELGEEVVNVSHHLGVLRNAGIAVDERHGRFIVYRLHPDVFQADPKQSEPEHLDFGCCRLEIPTPKRRASPSAPNDPTEG